MNDFLKLVPGSLTSLIGIAVLMGLLVMLGTIFQEWAKSIYRRSIFNGKEKRHEIKSEYNGYERRIENKNLENSLAELIHALAEERHEIAEFISFWKEYKIKVIDDLDDIKRKQDKNWKRLFEEELPSLKNGT